MSAVESSAFVLAGGRSSRMGRDKAFLAWGETTLVERALALARSITPRVFLVGDQERLSGLAPVVEDIYPGHGPLGGIHAALRASGSEFNLMLAVDTPFVTATFLRYLLQAAQDSAAMVTLPRVAKGWQPLCGVYRQGFAENAEAALKAGRNRVDRLFDDIAVQAIDEAEMLRLAFDPAMFDNLNTPGDFQRATQRACIP